MKIGKIRVDLTLNEASKAAMLQSFAAVASTLEQLPRSVANGFADALSSLLMGGDDGGDLVRFELVGLAAAGAGESEGLKILPGDRYIELVTALAGAADTHSISFSHGWPILSLGDRTPSVAEAGEPVSPAEGKA